MRELPGLWRLVTMSPRSGNLRALAQYRVIRTFRKPRSLLILSRSNQGESKMAEEKVGSKVLLMVSGGPDSATLAKVIRESEGSGTQIHGLYLRSGHPSDDKEIESANKILKGVGGKLEIIDISSTVTALGASRPMIHSEASIMPFGNVLVLSIASTFALRIGAKAIYIALHKDDADESYEYTEGYMSSIGDLFSSATARAAKIEAPFINIRKVEVFRKGHALKVDYSTTWSCIRGREKHCGDCGACRSRRRAFVQAGFPDPTDYEREPLAIDTVGIEVISA